MIRSIIVILALMSGGALFSVFNFGYSKAGENYISKHREQRKSIRPGYYYGGTYRGGGFRGGK